MGEINNMKIVSETRYNGNINDLLIIYGFNEDFYIGSDRYASFNVRVGR